MRKRISLLAAAGLVALGLTTPAAAAEPVFPLTGPSEIGLRLHPGTPTGVAKESLLAFSLDSPAAADGFQGTFTFAVDLGRLTGVADVREAPSANPACARTVTTLICEVTGTAGARPGFQLLLGAARGGADGAHGALTVTGSVKGATITPVTTEVTVGGPDLVMEKLPLTADLVTGQKQPVPLAFANTGNRAAHGVVLELAATRGMEFLEAYDNCTTRGGGVTAVTRCTFEGDFGPGEQYELADPLTLRATARAYEDQLGYGIYETGSRPDTGSALSAPAAGTAGTAGSSGAPGSTGKKLAVKKRTVAKKATDLEPGDNRREFAFRTANTADFAATGATLQGKAGQTVTADLGFRSQGPAWTGRPGDGAPVARTDIRVPAGTTVTKKPDACRAVNADGTERTAAQQLGAPRYFCASASAVLENDQVRYTFELRVDQVIEGAKGSVGVGAETPQGVTPHRFDPKTDNNTAEVVLNAKGGGTGPTPGPTGSPSPSASGSASPGPSTPASGSATPPATTPNHGPNGGLASTGSSAGTMALGAVVLLAAGGALYVAFRRRTGRA
ncbi:peptidase [Streptomyces sp. G-G2]|uniref:peptidase n=1 Tax=Streptomyces sp. G-G2 TaxID=3046201 RepID=UPI0024B97A81|nr:peptidase [Streptomyces sp. G-G2]MDJ0383401.1 peptidase [Streptomyces sp. G-G2]